MHYPGHLRDAFIDWIEAGQPSEVVVEVGYEPETWPAERLLGRLCHCTDVLPGDYCDDLEVPRGSTYAAAAQRLLHERRVSAAR